MVPTLDSTVVTLVSLMISLISSSLMNHQITIVVPWQVSCPSACCSNSTVDGAINNSMWTFYVWNHVVQVVRVYPWCLMKANLSSTYSRLSWSTSIPKEPLSGTCSMVYYRLGHLLERPNRFANVLKKPFLQNWPVFIELIKLSSSPSSNCSGS